MSHLKKIDDLFLQVLNLGLQVVKPLLQYHTLSSRVSFEKVFVLALNSTRLV